MLQLVFLLLIVPVIFGQFIRFLIKPGSEKSYSAFFFALGFLIMVAEFALICYPAIYFDIPFHIVCYFTLGVYLFECIAILVQLLPATQFKNELVINKTNISIWLKSPSFWIMVVICGFQIIRLFFAVPYQMRDSKSYNALIIDILQSNRLFRIDPVNGYPIKTVLEMPLKYSLSPWYPFISMLAKLSRYHSLIIINTILPAYILCLQYFILFSLGYYLFLKDTKKASLFTALCAFLYELTLYCHTPTMIKLVWPVWGKGVLSMTIVPAILVLYMLYTEKGPLEKSYPIFVVLFFLVIAGCSMSTMAALVLPLELGILGLIWIIKKRSMRPLICTIISCAPALVYLVVYYYLSHLQSLR